MNSKFFDVANSRNFFVTLVTVFLTAFQMNNLDLGLDPSSLVDVIIAKNWGALAGIVFINALNPIMKLITKAQAWSWDFLKSWNFRTQIITFALGALALFGIAFPTTAVGEIVVALQSGKLDLIVIALIINVISPIYHIFFVKKTPTPVNPA